MYGAAATVVIAPLLIGSGPPWAQLVSVGLTFATAALFLLARGFTVRPVSFAAPLALIVAMITLQLVPLPAPLVRLLSPVAYELRTDAGAAGTFLPLTLDVPATLIELAKAMAYLALLIVVGVTARRASRARPLVLALAFVGGVVAVVHIVQRVSGATEILGLYHVQHLPGSGFFGTFVNANQAASLLALSGLVAAGLALQSEGPLRVAATTSFLLSVAVVVTGGSRAGIAGLVAGLFTLAALALSRRYGRVRGVLLALALTSALAAGTLWSSEGMRARIAATAADHHKDLKIRGWIDSLRVVRAFPFVGVGRGAFEAPTSAYRTDSDGVRLAFPENIFLQLGAELGLPFTLGLLILLALDAARVARVIPRADAATQGAACGVLAVMVHELADFGLELPGVALPAVAALGLVVARREQVLDPKRESWQPLGARWVIPAVAGWGLALALGGWALPRTLIADGIRGRTLAARRAPGALAELAAAIRRHPADYYLELVAGGAAIAARDDSAGRHLNRAQRLNPSNPDVHLITARWLTRNGRRSQAALEYRLGRERGGEASYDEIWAAVGTRHLGNAVPQTDEHLLGVAGFLLAKGDVSEARQVSTRAVTAGGHTEEALLRRLRLASVSKSKPFIEEAARQLLELATQPTSYVAAGEALAQIGQPAAADAAIDSGLIANPYDPELILAGGRLRLGRGDLTGASLFLRRRREDTLTINDRIQFDELEAAVAEKVGDHVAAAALHAHAKSLTRLKAHPEQAD
ncbi:MAG TPA: O-antigen ligase family protein [Polyangia bacterium]|nr:O-antigen ligase family protein [Polyangia bacterium]